MTPNEALMLRIQVLEGHLRMHREAPDPRIEVEAMAVAELELLALGHLYTWKEDLLRASIEAATSLPSPITFTPDLMPTPMGLYLFDQPMTFQGTRDPLLGIGWGPCGDDRLTAILAYAIPTPERPVLGPLRTAANFVLLNGSDVAVIEKSVDRREIQTESEFDTKLGAQSLCRFLIASWLWLKQRVLVPAEQPVTSKVRKQAERAKVRSDVSVIILRRHQHPEHDSESHAVDWGCQWLVRGHWRQQFFAAKDEHRPIWIGPHVKGPADKPFKGPSETVFTVLR